MSITAAVATGPSAWDFSFTSIDGDQLPLSQYAVSYTHLTLPTT